MGKYNPYAQENMYRMEEEPPKMELNDYIVEYKRTGAGYWLACYLHHFEKSTLNGWVYRLCNKYSQLSRYKDFKQEMICAMLEKLETYDSAFGTTLLQYSARHMSNAIHDYMRTNGGVYLLSDDYYKNLRKVNAIFYRDRELSYEESIQIVMKETGFSLKHVLGYIEHGKWFRYPESIESNINDFVHAKLTPDSFASPDHIIPHKAFIQVYLKRIEDLRLRDKQLLFDYLGIVNHERGWVIDKRKIRFGDIADKHQLRDEQSVTNRYRRIVANLREELERQGWLEGKHTPKLPEAAEKETPELMELDREIIDYAIQKWKKSGLPAEIYMLFREVKTVDDKMIIEFLKLILY